MLAVIEFVEFNLIYLGQHEILKNNYKNQRKLATVYLLKQRTKYKSLGKDGLRAK